MAGEQGAIAVLHRPLPDEREIERIVRSHNRRLFRIARAILGDDAEAEDVVQDAYVQGFLHMHDYRADGPLEGWLCRIAVNLARGRLRTRQRRRLAGASDQPVDEALVGRVEHPDRLTPERDAAAGELRRLLQREIDALPDGIREVFVLRAVEELSVAETAATLDLLPATVKTRFHRARAQLRRALESRVAGLATELFPFAGARCDRIVARVLARLSAFRR
jgi:RNA polymerase sigma-70 factor (ECF subfamily)